MKRSIVLAVVAVLLGGLAPVAAAAPDTDRPARTVNAGRRDSPKVARQPRGPQKTAGGRQPRQRRPVREARRLPTDNRDAGRRARRRQAERREAAKSARELSRRDTDDRSAKSAGGIKHRQGKERRNRWTSRTTKSPHVRPWRPDLKSSRGPRRERPKYRPDRVSPIERPLGDASFDGGYHGGHGLGSVFHLLFHGFSCQCSSCTTHTRIYVDHGSGYEHGYGYDSWYSWLPTSITYYDGAHGESLVEPCPWTLAAAWDLLARGRDEAYDAFICLHQDMADEGSAAIGLSLSAALLGLHDEAYAAMREAARIDPEALRYIAADDRIRALIREGAHVYEDLARQAYGDIDALFMVAALRIALGEDVRAGYALDAGSSLGDTDAAVVNLRALIR